ncbi:uncharacterized protein LOC117326029 [Pecten maximus]|uniref:uncharacterized protein LOC117326029 n=1 Tax=Pecten maximus TaxID=6579 RepID=UPI0014583EC5|nr:uncharacterized protein LOC117326029 [Pecten maximus]
MVCVRIRQSIETVNTIRTIVHDNQRVRLGKDEFHICCRDIMFRYNQHEYACENVLYQCEECGRRFHTQQKLNHHRRNDHGPRIRCTECSYTTTQARRHRMRDHMRIHQRERQNRPSPRPILKSTVQFPPPVKTEHTPPQQRLLQQSNSPQISPLMSEWEGSPQVTLGEEVELHETLAEAMGWTHYNSVDQDSARKETPDKKASVEETSLPSGLPTMPESASLSKEMTPPPLSEATCERSKSPLQPRITETTAASTGGITETITRTEGIPTETLDNLAEDPRFFFLGAPSTILQGNTAQLMRRTRMAARRKGQLRRHFVPLGYLSVRREEVATLPDGTTYRLIDYWTRDPECKRTRECSTQTE